MKEELLVREGYSRHYPFSLTSDPFSCIDECFSPWGDLILPAYRVMCALVREERTLKVRHHGQVTTVGGTDRSRGEIRTVWIARILVIAVFHRNLNPLRLPVG